jgi:hypothetical protein
MGQVVGVIRFRSESSEKVVPSQRTRNILVRCCRPNAFWGSSFAQDISHQTPRITPAMAPGVADRGRDIADIVKLVEAQEHAGRLSG